MTGCAGAHNLAGLHGELAATTRGSAASHGRDMNESISAFADSQALLLAIVDTLDARGITNEFDRDLDGGTIKTHGVMFYIDADGGVIWQDYDVTGPVDDEQGALFIVEQAKRSELTYGSTIYLTTADRRQAQAADFLVEVDCWAENSDAEIAAEMKAEGWSIEGDGGEILTAIAAARAEHVTEEA